MISDWSIDSWKKGVVVQQPNWPDSTDLSDVISELSTLPALVFAGETRKLKQDLEKLEENNGFILQAGNCAESFNNCNGVKIHNFLRVIMSMTSIIEQKTSKRVVKIGRIAGQYSKPRSSQNEIVAGEKMEVYRGDNINDNSANFDSRVPNPKNLIKGYFYSTATLNLIRAFTQGGYTELAYNFDWKKHQFNLNSSNTLVNEFKSIESKQGEIFYISHEALVLDYEQAFTRLDTIYGGYYNTSAHMLWIGDRTRFLHSAHIEYARGINNPIGIKIGPNHNAEEICEIIDLLNPENKKGKIILIIRLGLDKIEFLNQLIDYISSKRLNVIWMSDPMHGNTKIYNGIKYRDYNEILSEFLRFLEICNLKHVYPGGVHLEITGEKVTECIGGNFDGINLDDLHLNYQSKVDPQLNALQSEEFASVISEFLKT
jgi:3-deoxy-7-phosphoheptulonate synthase